MAPAGYLVFARASSLTLAFSSRGTGEKRKSYHFQCEFWTTVAMSRLAHCTISALRLGATEAYDLEQN